MNIRVALERARYCSSLVNDFFELSVIDSKGCEPVMESVDVNDMLCELILYHTPDRTTMTWLAVWNKFLYRI